MANDGVNAKCDKAIEIINDCGHANYINDEMRNTLVDDIQTLKIQQDRSLASKLSALHENNLKRYIETKKSTPAFSQDYVKLQIECISLLNEVEAALYVQENFK